MRGNIVYGVMTESAKKPMFVGYLAQLQDARGRERYLEQLAVLGGVELYEIPRKDWTDDVDLWPAITYRTWYIRARGNVPGVIS